MSNDDLVDKLIARNPRIKSLSTYKIACLQQSMAVLSHLAKLDFRGELGAQDVVSVLEAFPRLQELSISGDIIDLQRLAVSDISTEEEDRSRWHSPLSSSPSLKRLSMLSGARADISPILERCPNLEWLQFPGMQTIWDATLNVLRSGLFSRLTTLSCVCLRDADEFERVLQAIPHLQLRNVSLCDPAASTIQALAKYHGQRLERLNLLYLLSIPENPLVVALSQFPALKSLIMETLSLYCTRLKLPDLRELINQPWSCSQLEHLDIPVTLERQQDAHIDAGEENGTPLSQSDPAVAEWEQAQTLFMERLGALTRLRQIQLWGYWKGRYQPGCDVTWRLSAGLGKLQGLRHLEGLYLGYPQHKLEITELQWMKQHFVRLKKLEVCGIEDGPLHDWLHDHWPELSVVDLNKVNDLDDDLIDY
ncbi:hypothetical protein DFQ26_000088 [Actinomortierella ambigua]|nr:hypothetical protein DFQ26_000088 [Actinomortierella ambigua]